MAGAPMFRKVRHFLDLNPDGTAEEIKARFGIAKGTAHAYIRRWKELTAARTQGQKTALSVVRPHVSELDPLTREAVVNELRRIHTYIEKTNRRLIAQHEEMKPIEHAQLTSAVQNAVRSAQSLGESYPGLLALVREASGTESGKTRMQDDIDAIDSWMDTA